MRGREFSCGYMESGTETAGASTTTTPPPKARQPTAGKNDVRERETQHATLLTSDIPLSPPRVRFFRPPAGCTGLPASASVRFALPDAGGAGAAQYFCMRRSIVTLGLRWACG